MEVIVLILKNASAYMPTNFLTQVEEVNVTDL